MTAKAKANELPTQVGDLAGLDALEHEAVALFVPSDIRPLRGVAGFVDWRTNGWLSRTVQSGTFRGESGEVLLAPTRGRLGQKRFFLFGIGPVAQCTHDSLRACCIKALEVCTQAGVRSVALAAPSGRAELERAFLSAAADVGRGRVDVVLVPPESHGS
ncbi:MAG: M17 family peptidase N-terminal domain-containing protein [Myxococcota bacterium]